MLAIIFLGFPKHDTQVNAQLNDFASLEALLMKLFAERVVNGGT